LANRFEFIIKKLLNFCNKFKIVALKKRFCDKLKRYIRFYFAKMSMQTATQRRAFEVLVIDDRCKECGLCIELCPTKILDRHDNYNRFGYRPTYIKDNAGCIGCKICEYACPEFAIFVRKADTK
jgi:2-oxoglutarate ferredoxin oxidoreductase subunit delta